MRLITHIWTSALAGMVLYPSRPQQALAVTLAGVLIDVDHYVMYALRSGDWNPQNALRYNAYRHLPRRPGDTRPRYGALRSGLHHPVTPLALWLLSLSRPALRPLALGVSLHLALDWWHLLGELPARRKAGWRCQLCGRRKQLQLHMIVHRRDGGHRTPDNLVLLCGRCHTAAQNSYPQFPPS